MEAGRILDALVSEKVLGIPVTFEHDNYWPPARPGANFSTQPIPEYSLDISAAWEVVEKLGGKLILEQSNVDGSWDAEFNPDVYENPRYNGKTAPHAICIAALKYIEANPSPSPRP